MDIVYPETAASVSYQPMEAFVELYIGEQKLTLLPPRHIISFEFIRGVNNIGGTFTIQLFDDNWEEVEYLCSRNQETVGLRYGFLNGKQSPFYNCTLSNYSLNFNTTGTILSLEGYTRGLYSNLENITLSTGTLNPTEAAKTVCRTAGWQVRDENFAPSITIDSSTVDSLNMINERPATYIITKLAPIAVRAEDGKGGYRFYLDDTESPPVAHFRPIDLEPNTIRTYVYMKGVDSTVKDLSISVEGIFGGSEFGKLVATGFSSTLIDAETKEVYSAAETINSTRVDVTGEYSHTSSTQYSANLDSAGSTPAQMSAQLRYRLSHTSVRPYEATLTILGDPEIRLTGDSRETIRIIIVTDNGDLHHCSGLYYIDSIIDNIDSSVMTTILKGVKTEDQDGIELVNYRELNR